MIRISMIRTVRWLRRGLGFLRRTLLPPRSTFMRVAYTVPRQVVLITARHDGKDNIWPVGLHMVLSMEPNFYGIAVSRAGYGADLVRRSGVFVVNFVPATWETVIFTCGNTSGRTVDKFAAAGLRKEEAETVDAPRLTDSLGVLQCRVRQTIDVGDHTFFIGEVTHKVLRADAPRLHFVDMRLKKRLGTLEGFSHRP